MTRPNVRSFGATTAALFKRYADNHRRRQTLKELGTMNDHMLEDVGLSRDDVVKELGYNPRSSQI